MSRKGAESGGDGNPVATAHEGKTHRQPKIGGRTMKRSLVLGIVSAVVAASLSGCATAPKPPETVAAKVQFKAYIDGDDTVMIKSNQLWYVHGTYQLPGKWNGNDEPTYINGEAWRPKWKAGNSDMYTVTNAPLPSAGEPKVYVVDKKYHWDRVWVDEQPSDKNDYTASIRIDDEAADGPRWYYFTIEW
jgi:hypothetical protein